MKINPVLLIRLCVVAVTFKVVFYYLGEKMTILVDCKSTKTKLVWILSWVPCCGKYGLLKDYLFSNLH